MKTIVQIQDKYIADSVKIDYSTRKGQEAANELKHFVAAELVGCGLNRKQAEQAIKDADDMYYLFAAEATSFMLHRN